MWGPAPAQGGKDAHPGERHPIWPGSCCDAGWGLNPALGKTGHSNLLEVIGKLQPWNVQFLIEKYFSMTPSSKNDLMGGKKAFLFSFFALLNKQYSRSEAGTGQQSQF